MNGQRVLILGASGLIGSAVALGLAKANEVHGLSRFTDERVAAELQSKGVKLIRMDAARSDFSELPDDYDYVFHEILMNPMECAKNAQLAFETHAYTVANTLRRFRRAKGIVLGSTGSVYMPSDMPVNEEHPLSSSESGIIENYVLSKICADQFADYFSRLYSVPTIILRYYYPYTTDRPSMISGIARTILAGEPMRANESLINPMFISDVAALTIKAAEACEVPPNIVNVGGDEIVTRRELAKIVGEVIGKPPVFARSDERASDSWVCEGRKRIRELGAEKVSLRQGIEKVIAGLG